MRVAVTGGAGFIGSNISDHLAGAGHDVVVIDDFSTGRREFLAEFPGRVVELDLLDEAADLAGALAGCEAVVHLAAHADVRYGWEHPRVDLEQNLHATLRVAEAARAAGVGHVLFSSTGSVYGEAHVIPTPEDALFPVQTSLYGAAKAAAEGFLGAYAAADLFDVTVFRFVSILGPRYTHGHVRDFVAKLRRNPDHLQVLGDGTQRKSYLHVDDCVAAVSSRLEAGDGFQAFNLGVDGYCTVRESAGWIASRLGLCPELQYTGGDRGWIGDNPFIWLDTSRIRATGWAPRHGIQQAIEATVDYLVEHPWVLDLDDAR